MHIVMIAAENDALPGGKVGGIGDVIRDLPPALADQGHSVSVITPGYQSLSRAAPVLKEDTIETTFGGRRETLKLYAMDAPGAKSGVRTWVAEHDLFGAGGPGSIYCAHDRDPFATDASKFALFCTGVAEALRRNLFGDVDLLHCHDWHAAPLLLLRRFSRPHHFLRNYRGVLSIHNLSIQGLRPLTNNASSLVSWFPELEAAPELVADPNHRDSINWMRTGINLADKVHAVSPTYAREILQPSDTARHFVGGEGLEQDLQAAHRAGRLVGILNGCNYSRAMEKPVGKTPLCQTMEAALDQWVDARSTIPAAHFHALRRVRDWRRKHRLESFTVTSVGRATEQKLGLLRYSLEGKAVLHHILDKMDDGFFIMLGSGDPHYELFLSQTMVEYSNFLFLEGYSDPLASSLYNYGDLFLMPSSFEPCGISQMLALRSGTPCLVHAVGGLADTVEDGTTGFIFNGNNIDEQATALLTTFTKAMRLRQNKPPIWREMCRTAMEVRFTWEQCAEKIVRDLYWTSPGNRGQAAS